MMPCGGEGSASDEPHTARGVSAAGDEPAAEGELDSPRRLACVFNFTGSEIAFLVLIGLIVLGPEKLPDAVRKFTKAYNEFKKMATGFQGEMKQAFDEPMRELRGTADAVRKAADFDLTLDGNKGEAQNESKATTGKPAESMRRDGGLNFGNTNAKRQERLGNEATQPDASVEPDASAPDEVTKVQDAGE